MNRVFLFLIVSLFVLSANGQNAPASFDLSDLGVRIEPDRRLMVVLAALEVATVKNAAGVDEKLINTPLTEKNLRFRKQLLQDNASLNEDLRRRISAFVGQHKRSHPKQSDAELIAPFISMAYSLGPLPDLSDPAVTHDLPGQLLDVLDFAPLAREFYRRSTMGAKIEDYVKEYRAESDGTLRTSTREMVGELLDYLHTRPKLTFTEKVKVETGRQNSKKATIAKVETREHERRFVIVPEKLAPRGNINFLNIRDDYFVVVPADADLIFSEARRAFLQFVVDPLVLVNSRETTGIRDWAKPLLDEQRKADPTISPDVFLAVTRSLVAAIDLRQAEYEQVRIATDQARAKIARMATDDEKRAVSAELEKFKQTLSDDTALRLYEDHEKGAVLSFYFAHQLKGIEDSGFDIASSLREMLAAFDPAKETTRIADSAEARKRAAAARSERRAHPETRVTVAENPVTTRLLEIQKTVAAKDYSKADTDLRQLLAQYPGDARIYYNLGRVAGIAAMGIEDADEQALKLQEAKASYSEVIKTANAKTDKALLSLTYVALARIYEHFNDPGYAVRLYDEALKLGPVTGGAHGEALAAKQKLVQPE